MKKKTHIYAFFALFLHFYQLNAQQISTDSSQQPNQLINNLINNDCTTVSNVTSAINGSINNIISYGTFDRGASTFPLQNGLILSTGSVSSAGNTLITENLSEGEIDWLTDSDIQDVLGISQTLNATSIEFDFSSVNNFIAFKYLFASDEYPFQLIINPLPVANQPNDIIVCDDDFDGFTEIDLTQQNNTILGNQNLNDYTISFFNSEINAIENIEPLNQNHVAYNNEIIFVRLENTITGCFDITEFSIIINEIPLISIPDQVVCLDDLPLVVSAETFNPLDSYLWSTNAITPQIEITEMGTYSVTITNQFGCQYTSTFNVTESQSAIINAVETIDFSDPNSITVTIDLNGNYLFQLNNGNPQTSNVFENVPIGYNSVTIIDQNGCAEVTRTVLVIDAPKHMSPNNDGDFDTWHIAGVETLPGTIVNIFDRKGKLIKQLNHDSLGWDGTYNGNNMPASDYWFVATIVQNGRTFEVTGHFALRR